MKTIQTKLETAALFSDDGNKRYLLKKFWDGKKPCMTVIMLAPSEASGIVLDNTTLLVLNNASRLGYGSVGIVNLFAILNDSDLTAAEAEDPVNLNIILEEVKRSDIVVYAPGVGKAKNPVFQERAAQVLEILKPYEDKMHCIVSKDGKARLMHPLTPIVREWVLEKVTITDCMNAAPKSPAEPVKEKRQPGRPKSKIITATNA